MGVNYTSLAGRVCQERTVTRCPQGRNKKNISVCNKLSKIESSMNKSIWQRFNEWIYVCVVEGVGKVEMTWELNVISLEAPSSAVIPFVFTAYGCKERKVLCVLGSVDLSSVDAPKWTYWHDLHHEQKWYPILSLYVVCCTLSYLGSCPIMVALEDKMTMLKSDPLVKSFRY